MFIQGKILSMGDDLSEVYRIKKEVYENELGYVLEDSSDMNDDMSIYVIVYEDTEFRKPVATGKMIYDGVTCSIDKVAVLKEYRKRKYGDFVVRMLLNKAFTSGINEVSLVCPTIIKDFFSKIGFIVIENDLIQSDSNYIRMSIKSVDLCSQCKK